MARALINVPASAKRGEVIEIKTLISHPMEPGYRTNSTGEVLPRDEDPVKAESARIFYERYVQAKNDPDYQQMRQAHRKEYG